MSNRALRRKVEAKERLLAALQKELNTPKPGTLMREASGALTPYPDLDVLMGLVVPDSTAVVNEGNVLKLGVTDPRTLPKRPARGSK